MIKNKLIKFKHANVSQSIDASFMFQSLKNNAQEAFELKVPKIS